MHLPMKSLPLLVDADEEVKSSPESGETHTLTHTSCWRQWAAQISYDTRVSLQLLRWRPSVCWSLRSRWDPDSSSLSVTSRATTCPCSAGTAPDTAGVWTKKAMSFRTHASVDNAPSVTEVCFMYNRALGALTEDVTFEKLVHSTVKGRLNQHLLKLLLCFYFRMNYILL